MKAIPLRPADPGRDFGILAAWFTSMEEDPSSEAGLRKYYEMEQARITQMVAEDEQGGLVGFYWAERNRVEADRIFFYLFVQPDQRRQGVGRQLYANMERVVCLRPVRSLRVNIWDTCPECRAFAERRGFRVRGHGFGMALDLDDFDDRPYDAPIARLKAEGFHFTSMEALGNTEEAQRKLYQLNLTAAMDTPGSEGERPWASFEDFQQHVCQSDWYKPGGQMVVIDTANGAWAAMSAITRMEGNEYAYNLFTGVDRPYRGRKLAQAVKVIALRYAREALNTHSVRTHHNALNLPMIAIDRKFGYRKLPGMFSLERLLNS